MIDVMAESCDEDIEIFLVSADVPESKFPVEALVDELNRGRSTMVK